MNVKTLCLAVLAGGDATGYEIKKALEDGPVGKFFHAAYGSIYPALASLEKEGLLTCSTQAQANRPSKKVYALTESGRETLAADLDFMPKEDKLRSEALTLLFFSHLLEPNHAEQVFASYLNHRRHAVEKMESNQCNPDKPGHQFVHAVGLAIYRAMADAMEANKHLLFQTKDD